MSTLFNGLIWLELPYQLLVRLHGHDSELIARASDSSLQGWVRVHELLRFIALEGSEDVGDQCTDKASYCEVHLEGSVFVLSVDTKVQFHHDTKCKRASETVILRN